MAEPIPVLMSTHPTNTHQDGEKLDLVSSNSSSSDSAANPTTRPILVHAETERSYNEQRASQNVTLQRTTSTTMSRVPSATIPPQFSLPREIVFIFVVCTAQILTQAGLAQSIAPLHVIGDSFDVTDSGKLSWLPAGFSLTVGTFILPAGRWGDLFGHKKLFVAGYAWYAVWSLVTGFSVWSHNYIFLCFCRAMQGAGAAVTLPNGIAVLARTYPPGRRKEMALALFGASAPGGYVLGAVFSGIFAQLVWWPWAYWVMGIILGLLALAACFVIPDMPVFGGKPSFSEFDPVGTLLGVTGLVMFNFAWNEGPAAGWGKVYVYVLLIIGLAMIAAFIYFEAKVARYPILPTSAFTRDTSFVFGCIAAGWASFGIWVYYLWQFWEVIRHNSILESASQMVPAGISGACAAIATGYLISRLQPGWLMLISMTAFMTGMILNATNPPSRTYWAQFFVSTVVTTWGMDMSFPSAVIVLSNQMPPEQQGVAASLVNTIVNYSISIGLGMAGTVEVHVNDGGRDILKGYRGAWYLGIGLDVLGICLAIGLTFSWRATTKAKEAKASEKGEKV